jgi:hypothetical protein
VCFVSSFCFVWFGFQPARPEATAIEMTPVCAPHNGVKRSGRDSDE